MMQAIIYTLALFALGINADPSVRAPGVAQPRMPTTSSSGATPTAVKPAVIADADPLISDEQPAATKLKKFLHIRNQYCGGEIMSGWEPGTVDVARKFCEEKEDCKAFVFKKGGADTWRPISKLTAQMADRAYDCFKVDEPRKPIVPEDDMSFPRRVYKRSRYLYCGGTITSNFEAGTIGEAKRYCDKHAKEHPEEGESCSAFVYNKYSQTFRGIMKLTAKQDDDKYDCYRVKTPIQYVDMPATPHEQKEEL